jgi:cytosine/adenosine deaminase-related metal-dependent hydrolase
LKMVSIRGKALVGPDLEYVENVLIRINEQGVIQEVSKKDDKADFTMSSSQILIPGFINGHTHVADACIKDFTYGLTLAEAVGSNGIKHSTLKSKTNAEKAESISNSLNLLIQNGFTTFIDFREEGIEGIKLLQNELKDKSIRAIILGRPYEEDSLTEIFEQSDGFGFSDVFSIEEDLMRHTQHLKENEREKLVAIHASESMEVISESLTKFGKPDIEKICEYPFFDFIVHATYSNESDLSFLKASNTSVISCPISNLYHGLKYPPIAMILKSGIILGLGTDNLFCNNPDPFRLMAFTLYSARSNNQKIEPKDILKTLTVNIGKIIKKKVGQIKEGFSGDLLGIELESPNTKFSKDVYTAVTMRADSSDIVFQMYKGNVVKWKDQK